MLPESREERTVLPIEVPFVDIYSLLSQLQFDPSQFKEQQDVLGVSGTYVTAVLRMYTELGGTEDILGKIIVSTIQREDTSVLRRMLTTQMIPWPLYELVAEEARLSLERANKPLGSTDRTYSPFMWGLGGIISEPRLVAATAVLPLETIIDSINNYNRTMNRVTTIELTEQPVSVEGGKIISVGIHRMQTPESIAKLDQLLQEQTQATQAERRAVIDAICYRDLATTLGAFVGVTLLGGRPAQHIVVQGNPTEETNIQVYYSGSGNNMFHRVGQVVLDAVGLYIHKTWGYAHRAWERIISRNIEHATYALDKVQLQKTIKENERLAREKARLEFLQQVTETNRKYAMARGLIHDIKNYALGMFAKAYAYARDASSFYQGYELSGTDTEIESRIEALLTTHTASPTKDMPTTLYLALSYVKETINAAKGIFSTASTGMHVEIDPNKTCVNYRTLLEEAVSLVRPIYDKKVDITFECPNIEVEVNPQYISATLKNLIENAAAASINTDTIGTVEIYVEDIPTPQTRFIETIIIQSGSMSPEVEEKLNTIEQRIATQELFTTKPQGNGLGTLVSYDVITRMYHGLLKFEAYDSGAITTMKIIV